MQLSGRIRPLLCTSEPSRRSSTIHSGPNSHPCMDLLSVIRGKRPLPRSDDGRTPGGGRWGGGGQFRLDTGSFFYICSRVSLIYSSCESPLPAPPCCAAPVSVQLASRLCEWCRFQRRPGSRRRFENTWSQTKVSHASF